MSQIYGDAFGTNNYWLPADGVTSVRFNKQASPPLATLNQGILYELNDGVLYFNGTGIAPIPVGNVTGPASSTDQCIALWNGTTGQVLEDSNIKCTFNTNPSNVSAILTEFADDLDNPIVGYCNGHHNFIAGGCEMSHDLFANGGSVNNECFGNVMIGEGGAAITDSVSGFNENVWIGFGPSGSHVVSGVGSTICGYGAAASITTAGGQCIYGSGAGSLITTGADNCCFGAGSLNTTSGSTNLALGFQSASALVSNESNNIIIGSSGVVGDQNTIRIGTTGSGAGQQNTCYIAGIYGVSPSSPQMATINSSGQLGSQAIPSSSVTLNGDSGSATGGTITIHGGGQFGAGQTLTFTGTGSTLSLNTTDSNDNTLIGIGTGTANPGHANTGYGSNCMGSLNGTSLVGRRNTCMGYQAGFSISTGNESVCIGYNCGGNFDTHSGNTCIGALSCNGLPSGDYNCCLGWSSGLNYVGTESSNICLMSQGIAAENNTIHIGNFGSGNAQQNATFLDGGNVSINNGNLTLGSTSGKFLYTNIASGTGSTTATFGTVTLVAGTATIACTSVTAFSQVFLTRTNVGSSTALGGLYVSAKTASTSFTITAANPASPGTTLTTDLSTVLWWLIN